jgi:hypothetical protein
VFAGRETRTVTEYQRDDATGALLRSVTVRESDWTEQDQAEILALQIYRDSLCECCGLPKDITQVHERDAPRFRVTHRMCQARRTLIDTQKPYNIPKEREKHPEWGAYVWSVGVEER